MGYIRTLFWILAAALLPTLSAAEKGADLESYRVGNPNSNTDVYIVTNWYCHHCQALEPSLQKFLPKLLEKSQVTFIDLSFPGYENLAKFNLAYLLNNKSDYLKIRPILEQLTQANPPATPETITAELKKNQIDVTPLQDTTYTQLRQNYKKIMDQYDVGKTPTMIVINRSTQAHKKLNGEQITEKNVMDAIK